MSVQLNRAPKESVPEDGTTSVIWKVPRDQVATQKRDQGAFREYNNN